MGCAGRGTPTQRDDVRVAGRWKAPTFATLLRTDAFIHQELIEILYHTLWETVHVFFEHRELGHDVGEAGFLYPFLGKEKQQTFDVVARSCRFHPDESA